MQVNLKKAAALSAALAAIPFAPAHAFRVDVYGPLPTQEHVEALRQQLVDQISAALRRNKAVYTIRKMVGEANMERISGLLASKAELEKNLAVLGAVPVRPSSTNLDAIARQAADLLNPEIARRAFGGNNIALEIQTDDLIVPNQKALRKAVRVIDEELQACNFNTKIELPKDVVDILTENDLV